MGASESDIEQGGSVCPDIGTYLPGGSAIGHAIRVKDMVTAATHEEGVWQIPPQGGPQAGGAATVEGTGWRLGLPPSGGCNDGGYYVEVV